MSIVPVNYCDQFFSDHRVKFIFHVLEKISLVALSVIAAYTSPKLFFPFFGTGIVLGTCLYWNKRISWPCNPEKSCSHEKQTCAHDDHENPTCSTEHGSGGCSQGFMEQLTGVQLPAPLKLGVNIAVTVGHIDHHSTIFVPIIGLNAGICIGSLLGDALPSLFEQSQNYGKGDPEVEAEMELVAGAAN